jgi:uncharacterized protein (DUF1697 family)
MPRYVALLRAISNLSMAPFRAALEELGFADVVSYGMSGNLVFSTPRTDVAAIEAAIGARLGTTAIVRSRPQLDRIVAADPLGSSVLFLARSPAAAAARALARLRFEGPRPVLRGRALYFVYPARLSGKRTPTDFERVLGVLGTARSARVVEALRGLLRAARPGGPLPAK